MAMPTMVLFFYSIQPGEIAQAVNGTHTTLPSSDAEMETDSGINLILSPKGVAFRPITVKIVVKQMNTPITPPGLHMTL